MERIAKDTCLMVCDLLEQYGVRRIVLSPGSRNAPMIVAVERSKAFESVVVIDERTAAFSALGMALASGEPVALVCTSGSALLNYSPAIAEAYYRRVPLVVISADRPAEWIDQDDSQTIRQPGALGNIVKATLDVSESIYAGKDGPWWLNRRLNDVLTAAIGGPAKGPVHINLQIGEPLTAMVDADMPRTHGKRILQAMAMGGRLPEELSEQFRKAQKVLFVIGFMAPDRATAELLDSVADAGCFVLKEAQSNLRCSSKYVSGCIDATLREERRSEGDFIPDLVVSMGGAILSRHVKAFLRREAKGATIWSVGHHDHAVDCFQGLDVRIEMAPQEFLASLAENPGKRALDFAERWAAAARSGHSENYAQAAEWSDLSAVHALMAHAPGGMHLQVSNGTAIRYVQLFRDYGKFASVECNRGVSGIDGCTSTAIGYASVCEAPTLLLTGDMSAAYDIGALALPFIPANFRMAVLNNAGGGIFRFIPTTRGLAELEKGFVAPPKLPLKGLAEAYGFRYLEAASMAEMTDVLPRFYDDCDKPTILNIITPAQKSADILINYFK